MVERNSIEQEEEEEMAILWPMVSISKSKPIIFPPSNHENLTISQDSFTSNSCLLSHSSSSSSSSDSGLGLISDSDSHSSFSPYASNSSPVFSSATVNDVSSVRFVSWIVNTLCSRFCYLVNYLWSSFSFGFSRNGVLKTAVLVLCFLFYRQRKRLRDGENGRQGLIRVIDEKDKKINQLLDQVSRMNQVLLGLHKARTPT